MWPFLVAGAATAAFGLGLERVTEGKERIGAREGYLVVSLLWLLVAVFGALPYVLAEPQLARPVDALFESMSGFSTTGSSVLTDIPAVSRSMLMWRQFTAWLGGVGIIVLFLAVLPRLRVGGRQALFKTEMPGPELPLATTIRQTARRFILLYVAITALEIAILPRLGLTGIDRADDALQRGRALVRDDRDGRLLPGGAVAGAVRARHAVGRRLLHARGRAPTSRCSTPASSGGGRACSRATRSSASGCSSSRWRPRSSWSS